MAALDHAPFKVGALKLAQAEQVTRVIGPILCGLYRHLIILAHERWQLERFEMVAEQYSKDPLGSALA